MKEISKKNQFTNKSALHLSEHINLYKKGNLTGQQIAISDKITGQGPTFCVF